MYIGSKDTVIVIIHPDALDIVKELSKILGNAKIKKLAKVSNKDS